VATNFYSSWASAQQTFRPCLLSLNFQI
jgi:hypothetical protein